MDRVLLSLFLAAGTLSADTVRLSDGRVLEGTIDAEEDARIHIRFEHGSFWVPREQVVSIERSLPPAEEYRARAKGVADADGHVSLAEWCRKHGLEAEAKAELEKAVRADPNHAGARKARGEVLVDGRWVPEADAMAAKGLVQRDGAWVTPTRARVLELIEKLRTEDPAAAWKALSLDESAKSEVKALLAETRASLERFAIPAVKRQVIDDARKGVLRVRIETLTVMQDDTKYGAEHCDDDARQEVEAGVATIAALREDPYRWWFEQDERRTAARRRFGDALSLAEKSGALDSEETAAARAFLDGLHLDIAPKDILADESLDHFHRYDEKEVRPSNEVVEKDLDDSAREEARLVNDYRRWMGVRPLRLDKRLIACARKHSKEMEDLHYFSHLSPTAGVRTAGDRARAEGFESNLIGENIAQGDNSPKEILEAWQRSPGHHKSLLDARFVTFGVARVGESWTLVFGGEPPR